jgi:hypothetical protein
MRRPTRPPRLRDPGFQPPLTFEDAWLLATNQRERVYRTARGTTFWMRAGWAGRGPRKDERVIRFMRPGRESSRAYEGCWGCRTNINRTYIDVYTAAVR